jgi:negative regulator of sigma-B (phosphoserine phosphatase)
MDHRFVWKTNQRSRTGGSCSGDGARCAPVRRAPDATVTTADDAAGTDDVGTTDAPAWLAAVVDGLGHGPAAAEATRRVLDALDTFSFASAKDMLPAVRACHEAARSTRGAVMAMAHVGTKGSLTWTGVGNIEGLICRREGLRFEVAEALISRAGVVGYQLPSLTTREVAFSGDDVLVMHTDGIAPGWLRTLGPVDRSAIADVVIDGFADGSDDACILVGWLEGADDG